MLLDLDIAMKGPSSVCLSLALARALRLRSMSVLLTLKLYKHDLVNHQQLARFDLNENNTKHVLTFDVEKITKLFQKICGSNENSWSTKRRFERKT